MKWLLQPPPVGETPAGLAQETEGRFWQITPRERSLFPLSGDSDCGLSQRTSRTVQEGSLALPYKRNDIGRRPPWQMLQESLDFIEVHRIECMKSNLLVNWHPIECTLTL